MDINTNANSISYDTGGHRKKIFLIRHAESQNNVAKREAKQAWHRLKRLAGLPTWQECYSISTLLSVPMDTDLSEEGVRMVTELRDLLQRQDFLQQHGIDLIVHSNLIRAKRTCREIFQYLLANVQNSSQVPEIVEHTDIFEKNVTEHLHGITGTHVSQRTEAFRQWLLQRKEAHIVVVGHSAFFRDLIETECGMDNCEVRQILLNTDTGKFEAAETLVHGGQALLLKQAE